MGRKAWAKVDKMRHQAERRFEEERARRAKKRIGGQFGSTTEKNIDASGADGGGSGAAGLYRSVVR